MPITELELNEAVMLSEQNPDDLELAEAAITIAGAYEREGVQRRTATRKFYTDRDTHGLDPDTLGEVARVYGGDTEQKYRLFNDRFFREFHGATQEQLDAMRPNLRKAYSEKVWGEPITDERAFYERQAAEFDFEDAIARKATAAALSGMGPLDAFADLETENAANALYTGRRKQWRDQFSEIARAERDRLAPYIPTVRAVADILQAKTGTGGEGTEDESYRQLAGYLMEVPKEDREFVIAAIASAGANDEAGRKGVMQKLAESFGRGLADYRENIPANLERSWALGLRNQIEAGFPVSAEDAADPERLLAAATSQMKTATATGMVPGGDLAPSSTVENPAQIPDEVKAQALALADELIDGIDLRAKLRGAAENQIDPVTSDWMPARGLYSAARSMPYTLAAIAPGGLVLNTLAMTETSYQQLRAANPDMTAGQAQAIASFSGPLQAGLERISGKVLTGRLPSFNRFANQVTVTRGAALRRFGARAGAAAGVEMLQENLQDSTPFLVQGMFSALSEDVPSVPWDDVFGDMAKNQGELFFAVLPLALIGAGAGTVRDFQGAREMLGSYDMLRAVGLTEAAASEVRAKTVAGDLAGAQSLLRSEFREIGADQKSLSEARAEAIPKLIEERERVRELVNKAGDLDMLPAIRNEGGGMFSLQFSGGSGMSFNTYEEADARRWQVASDVNLSLHQDTISTIRRLDSNIEAGRETKYLFSLEDPTLADMVAKGDTSEESAAQRLQIAEREYNEATTAAGLAGGTQEDRMATARILGSSVNEFQDEVIRTTIRLYQGATPLTLIEEKTEGDAKFMIQQLGLRKWMLSSLRTWEQASGDKLFRAVGDDQLTDQDIIEAWSALTQAYFVGRSKKGDQGPVFAGSRKNIAKLLASPLGSAMTGYARLFQSVWKRAALLDKARRDGTLDDDLEGFLAKSTGMSEQRVFEREVQREGEQLADEMGATFSVLTATQPGEFETFQSGETEIEFSVSRDGASAKIWKIETPSEKRGKGSARAALSEFVKSADESGMTLFLTPEPMDRGVTKAGLEKFYRSLGFIPNSGRNRDFSSREAMVRRPQSGSTFSLLPDASNLDTEFARMFSPFQRSPELRMKLGQEMLRRVLEMAQKLRPILRANRTKKSIEAERKTRQEELFSEKLDLLSPGEVQALSNTNLLEDNSLQPILSELLTEKTRKTKGGKTVRYWQGSLMSKSEAKRRGIDTTGGEWDAIPEGLPPYVWGGSITPDQAATMFGFDRPEMFFDALAGEIQARADSKAEIEAANRRVRELEREARDESRAWAEQAMKDRETVGSDRATLLGFLRTLDAITRALPAEVREKIGGSVALAKLVKSAKMLDEIESRVEKVDKELERWLQKEATDQVKAFFEKVAKSKNSKAGEAAKGKKNLPEIYKVMALAEKAFKSMSAEEGQSEGLRLQGLVDSGAIADDDVAATLMAAELIPLFSGWNGKTRDEVIDGKTKRIRIANPSDSAQKTAALEAAKKIWKEGVLKWKTRQAEIKERRDRIREQGEIDIAKANKLRTRDEQEILSKERKSLPGKIALNLMSFDGFFRWHLGDNSSVYKWITDSERKAANAYDDAVRNISKSVDDWFTKKAGSRFKGEKLRQKMAETYVELAPEKGEVRKLSQLQLITAQLIWRQEDGKRHMKGRRDNKGNIVSSWSYGDGFMAQVDAAMSEEAQELMDFLSDAYDKEYEPLNKVYRKLFGIDLPKHLLYSPLTVKPEIKNDAGADPVTGFFSGGLSGIAGALKTRGTSIVEPDFKDALKVYVAHSIQMEHFKAFAELARDARAIFGRVSFRDQIKRASGEEGITVLDGLLEVLDKGGIRSSGVYLESTKVLEQLTGRLSTMILFGKLQTIALNVTQLAAASVEMGPRTYWKQFAKLWFSPTDWAEALRTPYIQRRIDKMPPVIRQAIESNRKLGPSRLADINDKLGYGISASDGFFTAGTYAMVYDWKKQEAAKLGVPADQIEGFARNETERIMDRIAQPTRKGARSIFENNMGAEGRALFNFISEARKNLALLSYAAQKDRSKLAGTAQFVILLAGLSTLLRAGWQDLRDDDEEEDAAIWNIWKLALELGIDPLYGIPVIGGMIQDAIKAGFGFKTFGGTILESGQSAIPAARRALTMDYDPDEIDRIAGDVNAILGALGYFSRDAAALTSITNVVEDALKVYDNLTQ